MPQNEIDETRGHLVRSASTITPLTLLSRVTGYLRDKVIAVTLGAGLRSDAFFVAFRIPNMLREIIGEGAMSSAVIPVYVGVSAERSQEEARAFVGRVAATFALLLAAVTVAGILASPLLVSLLAGQFRQTPGKFELTVTLFRNIGRLMSRGHLQEAVWGRSGDLATRTVDTHVSQVRKKLDLRAESGYRVVPIYNYGYRLEKTSPAAV
jgi:hypothetical protein